MELNQSIKHLLTIANGNISGIFANLGTGAVGNAGKIDIKAGNLVVKDGGQINSFTRGQGNAGDITIQATDSITLDGLDSNGFPSGLFSSVGVGGVGNAGNINLILSDILEATNGEISTSSTKSSGGTINITAGDINLRQDSDIRSNIFSGAGGGGNINITADTIIAFDDSDIFAFAADGRGGNINLNTPAYFAENFTLNSLTSNPDNLENNSRADLNATGAVSSGAVSIPDVSFIQNGLNNLPDNSINTDELVANSCVSPVGKRQSGKFIITGTGGLPVRPGNDEISDFATIQPDLAITIFLQLLTVLSTHPPCRDFL
mgnify:FL=1